MNYTSNAFIMASAFNLHPEEGIACKHYAILAVKNIHTFFERLQAETDVNSSIELSLACFINTIILLF